MKQTTTKKTDIVDIDDGRIKLKHDGELPIATGKSRYETAWKNKTMLWSELLQRLKRSTVTQETHAEFMHMNKPDQDRIKDVGGFVGGHLKGGRRKSDTVELRQLIALDADFAPPGMLADIQTDLLPMPGAWAVYSTHKHTEESPRLRFLIPLKSPVTPEQYEAIARRIAGDIGIEYFDATTFQPARLMYWPSTPRDIAPVFDYMDTEWTDPEKVLATYSDWKDSSYWPVSEKEKEKLDHEKKKQGDPREKEGSIGLFCRTYTVEEAMEKFIPGVYEKCDGMKDRYTYKAGSTAAGLVIYEDGLFAYSNHSTDPAGGQLCNAFDLVRIHLYGAQDENVEDTTVTKLPSYKQMVQLVQKDPEVSKTLYRERGGLKDEFGELEDDEWVGRLEKNSKGFATTLNNLTIIMQNDPRISGICYNRMADMIEVRGPIGWKRSGRFWRDVDDAMLERFLASEYAEFPHQKIISAVSAAADDRAYHPVLDYLDSLPEWDGTPRVDTLLIDYLGADDNAYVRAVMRKTLVAAIARVKHPGCKFDTVLTLCGPQGIGKSTLFARLGGEWFSDSLSFSDTKDKAAAEKLQGNWIIELPELNGLTRAGVAAVRQFISSQDDKFRPSYGRRVTSHPRQCVLVGTTNAEEGYLSDTAGGRRFWPVNVSGEHLLDAWDMTRNEIDQIWAEALVRYEAGESLVLDPELAKFAEQAQLDALKSDDREGVIQEYLDRLLPENWGSLNMYDRRDFLRGTGQGTVRRQVVSNVEVWCECFEYEPKTLEMKNSREITAVLKKIGWKRVERRQRIPVYGLQRLYSRH